MTPKDCNLVVTSHRTHAFCRSPSVMCSLARNATSLHNPPDCNHVSWKERRYTSRSGVQCSPSSQFVRMKHQLRSCDCPNPRRLSGVSVVQHQTVRGQVGIVAEEVPLDLWIAAEHQLHRRDTRNRQQGALGFLQRVEALSPLVLRLWLHICQDVFQHELKQLCTVFNFSLLILRFFSRVHHFDALLFAPFHEFITVSHDADQLCASAVACIVSTRHQSAVSAVPSSPQGITACIRLPSQTTCRVFTLSPGIHPGRSLTCMAMLFRGGWTSTVSHGDVACRAFEVSCSFQGSLGRVCVPEMT